MKGLSFRRGFWNRKSEKVGLSKNGDAHEVLEYLRVPTRSPGEKRGGKRRGRRVLLVRR